jgi:hypothetical protein
VPYRLKVKLITASFRSKKITPYEILSLTYSSQEIAMFTTFLFCRDWEFRAMKIQALYRHILHANEFKNKKG